MLLMHGNIPVARLDETLQIEALINPKELPVGVLQESLALTNRRLLMWFGKRTIPDSRIFGARLQERMGCSFREAMLRANSISLTDTYWIKEEGSSLTFEQINFHDNVFCNKTMEQLLFSEIGDIDFRHPNFTTDGVLEKTWILLDGLPYLIKFDDSKKQLIGEVFASKVANMMGIPHVPYQSMQMADRSCVICPCLIDNPNTDMIFAMQYVWQNKTHGIGLYEHLSEMDYEGIQQMLLFDYLTCQEDRHEYNFAFTQNGKCLPLYDSGRCLSENQNTKPFVKSREEVASLLTMPFELPALSNIKLAYKEACEDFKVIPEEACYRRLEKSYEELEFIQERNYESPVMERE